MPETTRGYHGRSWPLHIIVQANIENNKKYQRRQILRQDQTKTTTENNQTAIKHRSETRKVKYGQTNLLKMDCVNRSSFTRKMSNSEHWMNWKTWQGYSY